MARQVPRLVERIRLRTARRARRATRGRPYLRRLFRDNLAHGGVPFVLPRRRPRPRRPRVVLFIDVSWSTALSAGLFLSMAAEFLRRARETRVLLFVDRAVDATSAVDAWLDHGRRDDRTFVTSPTTARSGRSRVASGIVRAGVSFADLLESLPGLNLDAPSDYGRAFHHLLRSPLRPAGRDTVLVILGDGRTNRFDPLDWSFEMIAERCGAVLWLVPEPVDQWGTGDSALTSYLGDVDTAVEARDMEGLARGVAEMVRRLRP